MRTNAGHLSRQLVDFWRATPGISTGTRQSAALYRHGGNRQAPHLPVSRCADCARQHAGLHRAGRCSDPRRALQQRACGLGTGRRAVGSVGRSIRVYNKTRCFDPFPFPAASEAQQARIRDLAEQLDAHRKRQQAAHPDLTLTGMYNVLEKLRDGEPLSAKERSIHEQGLVSVLRQLHDELDLAVLDAYGWSDLAAQLPGLTMAAADALHLSDREGSVDAPCGLIHPTKAKTAVVGWISAAHPPSPTQHDTAPLGGRFDETILERLVALNAERAAEEKRGHVRWLRPDFQNPNGQATAQQMAMDDATPAALAKGEKKLTWPKTLPEQVRAVADLIAASPMPLDADAIGTQFKASKTARERLRTILDTLIALGRVRRDAQGRYVGG
jgi:hypothetical protein